MSRRTQAFIILALSIIILIAINVLGAFFFGKIDLTEEKRFTLTEPTRNLLTNLDEVVYVQVLLDGDLPAGIKRLQTATQEMLADFRSYSGYVEYDFVNPAGGTVEEINANRKELAKDGIMPNNLRVKEADETREIIFYTYAIVTYKNRSMPVNLVDKDGGVLDDFTINNSISLLEYKLANAIQKLQTYKKPVIAFTQGHGELTEAQTGDFRRTISQHYKVGNFNLDSTSVISTEVDAIIIAKPRGPFSDRDKFLIDQYIMNGGKVIWLIDRMAINLDSLYQKDFLALDYPLNLEDQLFKYGARIEPNLVLDLQCTPIQLEIDANGTKDQFQWFYHPVALPTSDHPIVKNMDGINFLFPSKVDTIKTKTPVQKTVLLASSDKSREQYSPVRVNFEILRYKPDPDKFNKPNIPLAVLLEGEFPSLFEGRVSQGMNAMLNEIEQPFKATSTPTAQLVIGDGDLIKNLINKENQPVKSAGFNQFANYTFANKNFLINAIEYMLDGGGIIDARGRDVKLRFLNKEKADAEKTYWQLFNVVLPIVLLVLFGVIYNWFRRRKYAF